VAEQQARRKERTQEDRGNRHQQGWGWKGGGTGAFTDPSVRTKGLDEHIPTSPSR